MSYLTVDTKNIDGATVVYVNGYLNSLLGEEVERVVRGIAASREHRVLLNFEGTRLINSIGISFIIGAVEKVMERGGTLSFCSLSPINRELFQITGVARHVRTFDTEAEALAHIRAEAVV